MRDHRLGARSPGLGHLPRRALGRERRPQRFDVVGDRIGMLSHARWNHSRPLPCTINRRGDCRVDRQPAFSGRHVAADFASRSRPAYSRAVRP